MGRLCCWVNAGCDHNYDLEQSPYTQPEWAKHGACFCSPGTYWLAYTSVALQSWLWAENKSCYTKFNRKQVRGLDLSGFTKLSRKQELIAKTVTNKWPILSVLAKVLLFKDLAGFVLRVLYSSFFVFDLDFYFEVIWLHFFLTAEICRFT